MVDTVDLQATVPAALHGRRLDQAAAELFGEYSRSRLQTWIKDGQLRLAGRSARPRDRVTAGDELRLCAALDAAVGWQAQDIALNVVHEDEHLLVLDKPAGLVVHPAAGHASGTLVNALLAHAPELAQLPRAGLVHRLDRDTSGLLVVARTLPAHHALVGQLQARTVHREYCAICAGTPTGGGSVDAPIGRHPVQRKKMAVRASGGKRAVTHYRIARRFAHHAQLSVRLETGRTHQIRVHMAYRHHPLIGDPVYGGRPRMPAGASAELLAALRAFPRQALHAQRLGFVHPASSQPVSFTSPLPADMLTLLQVLAAEDAGDAAGVEMTEGVQKGSE